MTRTSVSPLESKRDMHIATLLRLTHLNLKIPVWFSKAPSGTQTTSLTTTSGFYTGSDSLYLFSAIPFFTPSPPLRLMSPMTHTEFLRSLEGEEFRPQSMKWLPAAVVCTASLDKQKLLTRVTLSGIRPGPHLPEGEDPLILTSRRGVPGVLQVFEDPFPFMYVWVRLR